MINISIDQSLKKASPSLMLGVVHASVKVEKGSDALWQEINKTISVVSKQYSLDSIPNISEITAVKNTYKRLGKDPSRYRGSAEALLRRILQGKGLYRVNNVVDINNLVSIETLCPVGSYNLENIEQPIIFKVGQEGESYKGIGKEIINIAGLPVFADKSGPYGSPTSDSERAMITNGAKNILMIVISFIGNKKMDKILKKVALRLEKFAEAKIIDKIIVE
ncbi:hypothetical protein D4R87_03250 [bacterium]|nr:MAG: hypothetical protein D4R87_03250 [bacterium]